MADVFSNLDFNALMIFGVVLLGGALGGALVHRVPMMPSITGFMLVGVLLGPDVLNVLTHEALLSARVFVDVALGLILFQLGLGLDLKSVLRDKGLMRMSMGESLLAFIGVGGVLVAFGASPLVAALVGAIGVSSSPAVLMLVARESGADGPVTRRGLAMVGLNNVIAFLMFSAILPWLHLSQQSGWTVILFDPLYRLIGSVLLGLLMGGALAWLVLVTHTAQSYRFAWIVGMIALGVGSSKMMHLSPLMTLLVMGLAARRWERAKLISRVDFGPGGNLFFIVLFVLAGAKLHLGALLSVGWMVFAFVAVRSTAKVLACVAVGRMAGLEWRQGASIGGVLVPMAGLAIGLTQTTQNLYPEIGAYLSSVVLASVAIFETVGPIVTLFALKAAGEVHEDASAEH